MAFLVVAGQTVPVAMGTAEATVQEVGDKGRAFDGTQLSTVRDRKDVYRIQTTPMLRTAANTLETALEGTPPLTCSGDLLGASTNCHVSQIRKQYRKYGDGERVVLSFELVEE